MSIFSKARIPIASVSRTQQVFKSNHVSTADFMQLNVVYKRELVPNQSIEVDTSVFCRTEALPVPTFGDCTIKLNAFFVPFRTIMPSWTDFITDTPHQQANGSVAGLVPFAHRVHLGLLSKTFITSPYLCTIVSQGTQDEPRDFSVTTGSRSNPTTTYYNMTSAGRQVYKLLRSLGYVVTPTLTDDVMADSKLYVSALPLLSLLRVYLDYYYPQSYVGDDDYNSLFAIVNHSPVAGYTLTSSDLGTLYLYIPYVCYENDYFVNAFDNPAGPNEGLYSSVNIADSTLSSSTTGVASVGSAGSNGTPRLGSSNNNLRYISQFAIDSLHKLSDYMKRHQLAGSRALERYLARFGVTLSSDKLNRCIHLGSYNLPLHFGAVMSNSDTDGARLGDFAGQGFAFDPSRNGKFTFDNGDEYGLFIITSSIVPDCGYVQGLDRNLLHLSALDFFTPEFDGLGTQAISKAELFNEYYHGDQNSSYDGEGVESHIDSVFGFTPRYSEYKIAHNQLTGDFLVPRLNGSLSTDASQFASNSWHLNRLFITAPVHSKGFVLPSYLSAGTDHGIKQFMRIFYNTSNSADHFVMVFNFNVRSSAPMKPLYDTYDFEDASRKVVDVETGSAKVN